MKISIVYVLLDFALVCDLLLCEACLYDYLCHIVLRTFPKLLDIVHVLCILMRPMHNDRPMFSLFVRNHFFF